MEKYTGLEQSFLPRGDQFTPFSIHRYLAGTCGNTPGWSRASYPGVTNSRRSRYTGHQPVSTDAYREKLRGFSVLDSPPVLSPLYAVRSHHCALGGWLKGPVVGPRLSTCPVSPLRRKIPSLCPGRSHHCALGGWLKGPVVGPRLSTCPVSPLRCKIPSLCPGRSHHCALGGWLKGPVVGPRLSTCPVSPLRCKIPSLCPGRLVEGACVIRQANSKQLIARLESQGGAGHRGHDPAQRVDTPTDFNSHSSRASVACMYVMADKWLPLHAGINRLPFPRVICRLDR
ncbi:hypothetical protein RRG08_056959 [Elysia crispata]|uniref:Uncharacterized protein n=1 Tax=Elysia crispata TaxID=231223 RepID=A0AAE0Y6W7_9GAST|nr:hypothetical protein RRG08_056959 [Elysia crispata]